MEGVSARQARVGAQAQSGEGQLTSYLEGRKVELMRDVTRAIFNDGLPIDCYIDTLIEASRYSKLSAVSCSDEEKVLFGLWYHGDYCPSEYPQRIGDRIVTLKCFCEKAHRDYPSQKVGGVYDENKRLCHERRKKTSVVIEAGLSLAACSLMEAEMDAGKAEDEYKKAVRFFRKASAENRCVAIKRMQSWLIQYAFANDVVTRCAWLEKIKRIKSTLDNKFSDVWQLVLIESGFYRGSEVLASPFILRDSLADFCFMNTKINNFYPRCAFEDCILHFSRTDIIAKPLYGIDSFSVLGSDYSILVNALHNAIFKDSAREKHHSDEIIDQLRQESGAMPRSRRVRRQKHTGAHTGAAQETTVASSSTFQVEATEEGLSLEKSALRVITKRAGLQATSATWDLCPESVFPEPEDIETAITILFNIMTYRNTKDKTFVYNRPNYKKRLEKCYDLLKSRCDDESLPLTLFGYIHFLLGWMHEEKLIADSSPDEAARFYEKATSKKQFFPLLKHASEIYENIGDFENAHRCLFLLREAIQDIKNEERTEESVPDSEAAESIGIPEGTEIKIGKTISYLSSEFQDILETKLQYLDVKKDEVVYLRGLSAAEVQSRIESTKDIPPVEEPQTLTLRKKKKKKKKKKNPGLCVDATEAGSVDSASTVAAVSKKSIQKLQGAEKTTISLDEDSKPDEHAEVENVEGALASGFEAEGVSDSGIETAVSVSGMPEDITVVNAITNLLSANWDAKVRRTIAELEASKKEGEESHIHNIQWLNGIIDDMAKSKRKKKKGVEALREHLAWEHIHSVSKGGHREVMREHLNKAKELLLMNLSRKVGVQYQDMPEPKQLEADVYAQLERVKKILSSAAIDEWLFGITCQTRSIAHVYSHFKAIYPNNQRFVQLYRSWYSLKSLYPYQS